MPTSADITAPLVIGWCVTALAFAGNLVWNFKNRQHTDNLGRDIRREKHELDIWLRHRSKIENRAEEFTTFVANLPGQVLALAPTADPKLSLPVWGYNVSLLHDSLARALAEADKSTYCYGNNWESLAQGGQNGHETNWDSILSLMSASEQLTTANEIVIAFKKMSVHALEIDRIIQHALNDCDFKYHPEK